VAVLTTRKKVLEHRRDREVTRKALSRFLSVLSPVTAIQLFTGPENKPLDARYAGLPPYGRRALERLRDEGIITLQRPFYRLADDGKKKLEEILSDDKKLDLFHLADKYLPKSKTDSDDSEDLASVFEQLDQAAAAVGGSDIEDVLDKAAENVQGLDPKTTPLEFATPFDPSAPQAEPEPKEGDEVPFPFYVAARFDHLQEQFTDLAEIVPVDTKDRLDALGAGIQAVRKDFEALAEMFLKTALAVEQIVDITKQDHEFLMSLRESLKPKVPTNHVQP
jgi:hypothetical protein